MRLSGGVFYVWGVGLLLAMVLSTRALVLSGLGIGVIGSIVAVSVFCCALQFSMGHLLGSRSGASGGSGASGADDRFTAGQALGQKNTGFLIWLGYSYLTPVTSVAGGLYAIWQNLFNSWQLYRKEKDSGGW